MPRHPGHHSAPPEVPARMWAVPGSTLDGESAPPSSVHPGEDRARSAGRAVWPSAADRGLLWLLRLTGQTGGAGLPARLYAIILYILLTVTSGITVVNLTTLGVTALRSGQSFLEAAFGSYFFGSVQALMVAPLTSTLVCGRRRYAALLSDVQTLLEETAQTIEGQTIYTLLRRRSSVLAGTMAVSVLVVVVLQALTTKSELTKPCGDSTLACFIAAWSYVVVWVALIMSQQLIPVKFLYMTLLLSGGLGAVDAELRSLAGDGDLKDWARLVRLRGLHDRLSTAFSRLVTDMTPELISTIVSGITSLVMSFLTLFLSATVDTPFLYLGMVYYMLLAAVLIGMPCEAGQHVLDLAAATRGSLLRLHWETSRVGQEVGMFQEAVRRDLEHLGDLGYYRLQRSTMVSIMSTIITYIVIFVQFKMSEGGVETVQATAM